VLVLRPVPICALAVVAACSSSDPPPTRGVRFVHTFSPAEAAALDELLTNTHRSVEATLLPFARGEAVLGQAMRKPDDCPDLARIDATWLPALAGAGLLAAPPAELAARDWLPEARELASHDGALAAVPMSTDGLVLLHRDPPPQPWPAPGQWPPQDLDALEAAGRALTAPGRWGLGLRVDGYWLVPFLRARGADVADGARGTLGVDGVAAEAALSEMAALMQPGGPAAPPAPPGTEAETEARRFRSGAIAVLVTGPWALPEITDVRGGQLAGVAAAALPGAPRGGQLLVVPRCAKDAAGAWQVAAALTDPDVQAAWSMRLGMVPTTAAGLARAGTVAKQVHAALMTAVPLPRHPASAALFDDLNPAVAAVVAGDATAAEAMGGVRRAWGRLIADGAP
jgi:arabinogalactan oligomer/maltooligosaccharide transport system substrate-binding protein